MRFGAVLPERTVRCRVQQNGTAPHRTVGLSKIDCVSRREIVTLKRTAIGRSTSSTTAKGPLARRDLVGHYNSVFHRASRCHTAIDRYRDTTSLKNSTARPPSLCYAYYFLLSATSVYPADRNRSCRLVSNRMWRQRKSPSTKHATVRL